MTDEKNKSQTRPKAVIYDAKEAKTLVRCPVCHQGMVSPEVAVKIAELLECEHDGPNANENE